MNIIMLSLIFGIYCSLSTWIVLRFAYPELAWLAIPTGISVTVVMSAILKTILSFENKRYRRAEARFTQTPVFNCKGVLYVGKEIRAARLYLFHDNVTVLSLAKKPVLEYSIALSDIREIKRGSKRNGVILHLYKFDASMEIHFFSHEGEQAADRIMDAIEDMKEIAISEDRTNHN